MSVIQKIIFLLSVILIGCSTPHQINKANPSASKSDTLDSNEESNWAYYRATYEQPWDLIHTTLHVQPIWANQTLIGNAEINLHPHWYTTDSITLNARGMIINHVAVLNKGILTDTVSYACNNDLLKIKFNSCFSRNDTIQVMVNYIAQPELLINKGSDAIQGDKGLYFINASGKDPDKPTQLWTQGETESNSAWFPTIESPAQKMTQDVFITVSKDFTTLSNGLLVESKNNDDSTKTDHWRQTLPAAPYLTMMAIGHFSVTKDHWKDKEVSYYTDPEYGKYARNIFGETPSMIDFFSNILGTPYPWEKFAQVVVHDYVSGAMENTTAVVHGTNMQQDPREMLDGDYSDYIAHELFHHWFGDLVTCESWSNITLNEGFADYSEYLWREHRYGKELADQEFKKSMSSYISYSKQQDPPLIRHFYTDKEDVYDAISYNKGGCVLHMLRQEVGDEAFYAALKDYLSVNAFKATEINDLKKSFEKITGRDLNWFFDQWFINGGHPVLNISYQWNDTTLTQTVTIEQLQDTKIYPVYRLPLKIDVYLKDSIDHRNVICDNKISTFSFSYSSKPMLVNVDASKSLLCSKKDQHTNEEWCFQYNHAPLYADRHEALTALSKKYSFGTNEAKVIRKALTDPAPRLREIAAENIGTWAKKDSSATLALLADRLSNDTVADVRLAALKALNKNYEYESFSNLVWSASHDKSYQVAAEAFEIISNNDSATASKLAEELKQDSGSAIIAALAVYYAKQIHIDHYDFFDRAIRRTRFWDRAAVIKAFGNYLITQPYENRHKGISRLIVYTQQTSGRFSRSAGIAALRNIKKHLEDKAEGNKLFNEPQKDLNQYEIEIERINSVLEEFDKKNAESESFEH